jgi:diphthamide biosynthesis protein 4
VSLEEFTPLPSEDDADRYTLACRCGQEYVITVDDLEDGVDVIGCPGCGEYIGVEYEVVEEE